MYLLIGHHPDTKDFDFIGPFPNEAKAWDYAQAANKDYNQQIKWSVRPLIGPYSVFIKVVWRE